MLEGRLLQYRVGQKTLVNDVSVSVKPGQIVVVVGANGAGKSTLLKLLAGELDPFAGEVTIDGLPVRQWDKRELAKVRAVLPQASQLSFGFTALEVVLIGRTPHIRGRERPEDFMIAQEALAAAHVEHLAHRSYTTLSGGERQRVQLARVLAQVWQGHEPRYLLLDEPTNNLDLAHQHGTLEIAAEFSQRGVGVLAILHDLNLAAQYADHIVVMQAGQLLASGYPQMVLTPEIIQQAFAMSVMIEQHPCLDCPLVIAMPQTTYTKPKEKIKR